jgi:hypothetical protein
VSVDRATGFPLAEAGDNALGPAIHLDEAVATVGPSAAVEPEQLGTVRVEHALRDAVRVPEDVHRHRLPLAREDLVDGDRSALLPRLDVAGAPQHGGVHAPQERSRRIVGEPSKGGERAGAQPRLLPARVERGGSRRVRPPATSMRAQCGWQ